VRVQHPDLGWSYLPQHHRRDQDRPQGSGSAERVLRFSFVPVRVPELDGLRGVAILLVVVSHAFTGLDGGGIVGVHLFFVLSGFLITGILLRRGLTWRFYRRRAIRLFPALALVLAVYLALTPLTGFDPVSALVGASYLGNWTGIPHLQHLWSLAVEEQFYVVWPLALVVLLQLGHRGAAWVTGLLIVVLSFKRWWAFEYGPQSWTRIYFGTDFVAVSLLAGCLLAQLRALGHRLDVRRVAPLALVALVALAAFMPGRAFQADGGLTAIALLGAVVIASPPHFLAQPWLVWFGVISYGLYLWHGLLINAGDALVDAPKFLFAGLAVLVAWGSWRWLEEPLLHNRNRVLIRQIALQVIALGRR
jgi:peptidoglycan/LPS O-acetylase OafA/YrhL